MPTPSRLPTYAACVELVLSGSAEPLTADELVEGVRRCRTITKGARSAIGRALEALYQAVPLVDARYGWLPTLMRDSVIRHTLEGEEMRGGFLLLDELEHALFFPRFFQNLEAEERTLQIDLFGEEIIEAKLSARNGMWALAFGPRFGAWLEEGGAMPGDDLLLRAVDAAAGRYSLRLQPVEARDEPAIHERNAALAQLAEELGREILGRHSLYTWQLVARLMGRGFFHHATPPDDLHFVLEEYSRLHLVEGLGYELQLAEGQSAEQTGQGAGLRSGRGGQGSAASESTRTAKAARPPAEKKSNKPAADNSASGFQSLNKRIVFGPRSANGAQGDGMKSPFESDEPGEDTCEAYEEYLAAHEEAQRRGDPLTHDDYHLLEAELESLVDLELEFGYLMADQNQRKLELADRLFIDPESLVDGSWDDDEELGGDGPILWN